MEGNEVSEVKVCMHVCIYNVWSWIPGLAKPPEIYGLYMVLQTEMEWE